MRTLIISDLHLGQRPGHDVLRWPQPRRRLLEAIDGVDRLVLLGDVFELATRSSPRALAVAEPIVREIAERVGPERELILVPGNHDQALARSWARARGTALGVADEVPLDATPALRRIAPWLAAARLRVSYPGVWLGDGVWASHGHYLDRHLLPESTFGLPAGRRGGSPAPGARAVEYEWPRRARPHHQRVGQDDDSMRSRLGQRPVATLLELAAEGTRYASRLLMALHLSALTAGVLDLQMRRAAVPAFARVAARLSVDAQWLIFGHVHRLGPGTGRQWQPVAGGPRVLNTGSWLYEPVLLTGAHPPHPYWPGGAVMLDTGQPPRAVSLLADLGPGQLTAPH